MMGRKAQPIELLLIQGKKHLSKKEIDQRRTNEQSIKPKSDKIKAPNWLDSFAKKEFKRISSELMSFNLLTNVDVDALAAYCDAYSEYVKCTEIIQEEGLMVEYTNKAAETNKVPHPLLTKKKALFEQMKSISTEFGLTPASRAKISLPKQEEKQKTEEELLFGDSL